MIHRPTSAVPPLTTRAGLCGLFILGLFATCVPESEQVPDTSPTSDCGQRARIDAQVKELAASDFTSAGKPCQPYDMQLSTTNPQETLWRVCCGDTAFTYIYFPQKCVVRRAAGPFACK